MMKNINYNELFIFGDTLRKDLRIFKNPLVKAFSDGRISCLEWSNNSNDIFNAPFEALNIILKLQKEKKLYLAVAISYECSSLFEDIPKLEEAEYKFPIYNVYAYTEEITNNEKTNIISDIYKNNKINNTSQLELKNLSSYSNTSHHEYLNKVEKTIEQIKHGRSYQVNLSQLFTLPYSLEASLFYKELALSHPAPYSSFFNINSNILNVNGTIVSNSPELFLKKTENILTTRPIKGTRPRGNNEIEDNKLKDELYLSKKDQAELTMIVDLERNDLSRISKTGTVKVIEHSIIETYSNVFHLVSEVQGEIEENILFLDILKAMFPCGSISGAPKIASQEIIYSTEKSLRNIYTGSIGIIEPNLDLTLNVAIRTGFITNNNLYFNAGGGIVFDSNPEKEYQETLTKAKAFYQTWSSLHK